MFQKVDVPTIGIIENMSYYSNPDGSKEYIFGKDGGRMMSEEFKVKLLGEIPINTKIRIGGDEGVPIVDSLPDSETAKIFTGISKELIKEVNLMNTNDANSQNVVIEI